MTSRVRLIRDGFEQLAEMPVAVAMLFYGRLFELAPSLRPLFPPDMQSQARKLAETLKVVVDAAGDLDSIDAQLLAIGRKHVDYGARPEDYAVVQQALLWAIGQALDHGLDSESREAWQWLLGHVCGRMLVGAQREGGPEPLEPPPQAEREASPRT